MDRDQLNQEVGEPAALLIDPAIWYSPSRRLQTGLVRSLLTESPPPAVDRASTLPRYVCEGLATKYARRQQQGQQNVNSADPSRPLSPRPSLISIGTPTSMPPSEWPLTVGGDAMRPSSSQALTMRPPSHSHQYPTIASDSSLYNTLEPDDVSFHNQLLPLGYENILPGIQPGFLLWEGPSSLGTGEGQPETTAIYDVATHSSRPPTSDHAGRRISFTRPPLVTLPDYSPYPLATTSSAASSQSRIKQTDSWRAQVPSSATAATEAKLPAASLASRPTAGGSTLSLAPPLPFPAVEAHAHHHLPYRSERQRRVSLGKRASANYRGDLSNPNNHSADVPADQNTAVFIEGLPADCTVRELVGGGNGDGEEASASNSASGLFGSARPKTPALLHGTGKIYALSVAGPKPQAGIRTSCAKLVYWDRSGVDRLLEKFARANDGTEEGVNAGGAGGLSVRGHRLRVKMNWYMTAPQPPSERSRVVIVEGPSLIVNEKRLTAFFAAFFTWDIDEVLEHWRRGGRTQMEWRFASHRAQASEAFRRLVQARAGHLPAAKVEGEGEGDRKGEEGLDLTLDLPVEEGAQRREQEQELTQEEERRMWRQINVSWGLDPCDPSSYP